MSIPSEQEYEAFVDDVICRLKYNLSADGNAKGQLPAGSKRQKIHSALWRIKAAASKTGPAGMNVLLGRYALGADDALYLQSGLAALWSSAESAKCGEKNDSLALAPAGLYAPDAVDGIRTGLIKALLRQNHKTRENAKDTVTRVATAFVAVLKVDNVKKAFGTALSGDGFEEACRALASGDANPDKALASMHLKAFKKGLIDVHQMLVDDGDARAFAERIEGAIVKDVEDLKAQMAADAAKHAFALEKAEDRRKKQMVKTALRLFNSKRNCEAAKRELERQHAEAIGRINADAARMEGELRSAIEAKQRELESVQAQLAAARRSFDQCNDVRKKESEKVRKLTAELTDVRGERDGLQRNLDANQRLFDAVSADLDDARNTVSSLRGERDGLQSDLFAKQKALDACNAKLQAARSGIIDASATIAATEEMVQELTAERDGIRAELDAERTKLGVECESLSSKLLAKEAELRTKEAELEACEAAQRTLDKQLAERQSALDKQTEEAAALEAVLVQTEMRHAAELKAAQEEKKSQAASTTADHTKRVEELEAKYKAIVQRQQEDHEAAIERQKREHRTRLEARRRQHEEKIANMEAECDAKCAELTKQLRKERNALKDQLKECEDELALIRGERERLRRSLEISNTEKQAFEARLEAAEAEHASRMQELTARILQLQTEIDGLTQCSTDTLEVYRRVETLESDLLSLSGRLRDAELDKGSVQLDKGLDDRELAGAKQKIQDLRKILRNVALLSSEKLQTQYRHLEQQLQAYEENYNRLVRQNQEVIDQLRAIPAETQDAQEQAEREELIRDEAANSVYIQVASMNMNAVQTALKQLEESLKDPGCDTTQGSRKRAREAEEALVTVDKEVEQLRNKILKSYDQILEGLVEPLEQELLGPLQTYVAPRMAALQRVDPISMLNLARDRTLLAESNNIVVRQRPYVEIVNLTPASDVFDASQGRLVARFVQNTSMNAAQINVYTEALMSLINAASTHGLYRRFENRPTLDMCFDLTKAPIVVFPIGDMQLSDDIKTAMVKLLRWLYNEHTETGFSEVVFGKTNCLVFEINPQRAMQLQNERLLLETEGFRDQVAKIQADMPKLGMSSQYYSVSEGVVPTAILQATAFCIVDASQDRQQLQSVAEILESDATNTAITGVVNETTGSLKNVTRTGRRALERRIWTICRRVLLGAGVVYAVSYTALLFKPLTAEQHRDRIVAICRASENKDLTCRSNPDRTPRWPALEPVIARGQEMAFKELYPPPPSSPAYNPVYGYDDTVSPRRPPPTPEEAAAQEAIRQAAARERADARVARQRFNQDPFNSLGSSLSNDSHLSDHVVKAYAIARGLVGQRSPIEAAPADAETEHPNDQRLAFALPDPYTMASVLPAIEHIAQDHPLTTEDNAKIQKMVSSTSASVSMATVESAFRRLNGDFAMTSHAKTDEALSIDSNGGEDEVHEVRWMPTGTHGATMARCAVLEHASARCLHVAAQPTTPSSEATALRQVAAVLKLQQLPHMYRMSEALTYEEEDAPTTGVEVTEGKTLVTRPCARVQGCLSFPVDAGVAAVDEGHKPAIVADLAVAGERKKESNAMRNSIRKTGVQPVIHIASKPSDLAFRPKPASSTGAGPPMINADMMNSVLGLTPAELKVQRWLAMAKHGLRAAAALGCEEEAVNSAIANALDSNNHLNASDKTSAFDRRDALWTEFQRNLAIAPDRLWVFVRTLSGVMGDDVTSIITQADAEMQRATKALAEQRLVITKRVSDMQAKVVEQALGGLMKDTKLALNADSFAKEFVVIDPEMKRSMRELASGESGRPYFEANVALRNMSKQDQPTRLVDLLSSLGDVGLKLQDSLEANLIDTQMAGASLTELSHPSNSYFVHFKPDVIAAIRTTHDMLNVELATKGGSRPVSLWELVEGGCSDLSSRFAQMVGYVLVQARASTGVSAMYIGSHRIQANAHQARVGLQRLVHMCLTYTNRIGHAPNYENMDNGRSQHIERASAIDSNTMVEGMRVPFAPKLLSWHQHASGFGHVGRPGW